MARFHANWIESFYNWVAPRSEAPESFIKLVGLFTIAAVVKKHVFLPKENLLGGWECYPNIYVVLVAEPGVARKGSTMYFGEQLLFATPNLVASPNFITQASMMSAMTESPDGSIYVAADELASIFQKSKGDLIDFLVDGYDTRKPMSGRTIYRGSEVIEKPCINFFACTQPGWIKENLPESVISGGFASRTLFAFESEPRQRRMYYPNLDYEVINDTFVTLTKDLEYISDIKGKFSIEADTMEQVEEWYQNILPTEALDSHPKLKSYFSRKQVHLHKIAMLYHLSYSDDLTLNAADFNYAFDLLFYIERNAKYIFEAIGKNRYQSELDMIRSYIKLKKRVTLPDLYNRFQSIADPDKLKGLFTFFKLSGEIREVNTNGLVYLEYVGKKKESP